MQHLLHQRKDILPIHFSYFSLTFFGLKLNILTWLQTLPNLNSQFYSYHLLPQILCLVTKLKKEAKKREKIGKIFGEIRNEVLKNKLHEMKVFQIKLYIFARTRRQTKIYTYLYIPHFDWKFVILLKTFLKAQIQVPNLVWSQMSMVC